MPQKLEELTVLAAEVHRGVGLYFVMSLIQRTVWEAAFRFFAQRFLIASAMRLRAAGLMPRRLPLIVAVGFAGDADLALRDAHRAFMASDRRFLPAGDIPCPRPRGRPLRGDPFV
jgi:hypothetical protein